MIWKTPVICAIICRHKLYWTYLGTLIKTFFLTHRRRGSDLRAMDVAAEGQPEALWVRSLVQVGGEGSCLKLLLINSINQLITKKQTTTTTKLKVNQFSCPNKQTSTQKNQTKQIRETHEKKTGGRIFHFQLCLLIVHRNDWGELGA